MVIWHRTYGKDSSDSERENPMPPHGLFFPIQVRSECLSCCSALLSWAQVAYVKERKIMGEGLRGRGTACTGGYKGEQAVRLSD